MRKLSDSVHYLKGVGPKRAAVLHRLGIATIGDMLQFFPRKYVDRGHVVPIGSLSPGSEAAVRARLVEMRAPRWGDRLEALIEDSTGSMRVIWFHARFLVTALETGAEYLCYGRVGEYRGRLQMQHPKFERVREGAGHEDRILVEYPTTEGLQQASLARAAAEALRIGLPLVKETLPEEMRWRLGRRWEPRRGQWPRLSLCEREPGRLLLLRCRHGQDPLEEDVCRPQHRSVRHRLRRR